MSPRSRGNVLHKLLSNEGSLRDLKVSSLDWRFNDCLKRLWMHFVPGVEQEMSTLGDRLSSPVKSL